MFKDLPESTHIPPLGLTLQHRTELAITSRDNCTYLGGVLQILPILKMSQTAQQLLHFLVDLFSQHVVTISEEKEIVKAC